MAALQAGGLLARRYRLIDRIGAGGMSVIWRARDEVLDRVVAVKVLAASLAADTKFREMVRDEARAAAQLVHPHVTAVHDYGEALGPDGELTAFVVMELLTGEELKAQLTAGALPWPTAVEICAQVAEALAAAHRLGIVHRDITPANIMMTATGAKVLDFGIATHVGAPDEDEDGETFGTPAYVAPERLDGLPAQPATDTYSLGVLLHETLTGRVPFPAETWEELTRALESGAEPTLDGVPDVPAAVADVCLRCLARDPAARPTAAQVGETLRGQLRDAGPHRAPVDRAGPVTGRAAPGTRVSTGPSAPVVPPSDAVSPAPAGLSVAAGPSTPVVPPMTRLEPPGSVPPSDPPPGPSARFDSPPGGGPGDPAAGESGASGPSHQPSHPGRVLVVAAAALVVLTAVVIVTATLGAGPGGTPSGGLGTGGASSTGPGGTPTARVPSDGPAAAPTPTTARATATAPATATVRRPGATTSVNEVMASLDRIVTEGLAASAIRDHAGVDLRNHLRNLRAEPTDLPGQVTLLRDKVAVRRDEGSITPEYARLLDDALVQLAGAA
ncbi:serine/threonine-protein kinase [Plantactinospora sonchi]|uniref:non-specific serine/threonine protein kinase n=1 Tax=Plantactinospora sonchi TaxID=1544735 RepID=A0ABU7RLN7_9ACTN